ncbi:hypothetical protein [Glaciihabitans sp. UYNi722]|uniref:hypothetical protein n=1 Tax=Glaciihabitans sp. UYNi722 TaxID=3156344 RepID=UPI003393B3A9
MAFTERVGGMSAVPSVDECLLSGREIRGAATTSQCVRSQIGVLALTQQERRKRMAIKTISIDGVDYVRADQVTIDASETQIVVGQRGWIFVGAVHEDGDDLVITDARNIRIWGTTKGLGELASGPTDKTKSDLYGTVRIPKLTVVARINVTAGAWA